MARPRKAVEGPVSIVPPRNDNAETVDVTFSNNLVSFSLRIHAAPTTAKE